MNIKLNAFMSFVLAGFGNRLTLGATVGNTKDVIKQGGLNQSIDVYVDVLSNVTPRTYSAANKAANVDYTFDSVDLSSVPVTLDSELYAALQIDGWDTLVIEAENIAKVLPFAKDLINKLVPQIELGIAALLDAVVDVPVTVAAGTLSEQGEAIVSQITDDSLELDSRGVSQESRFLAVGRNVAQRLLSNKDLINAEKSGSTDALRKAVIGEIAGFTVVKAHNIDPDSSVAYHSDAFVIASREPGTNISAVYSAVVSDEEAVVDLRFNILGLGKRNATGLIVSTFYTVADIDSENRAVRHVYDFEV